MRALVEMSTGKLSTATLGGYMFSEVFGLFSLEIGCCADTCVSSAAARGSTASCLTSTLRC